MKRSSVGKSEIKSKSNTIISPTSTQGLQGHIPFIPLIRRRFKVSLLLVCRHRIPFLLARAAKH